MGPQDYKNSKFTGNWRTLKGGVTSEFFDPNLFDMLLDTEESYEDIPTDTNNDKLEGPVVQHLQKQSWVPNDEKEIRKKVRTNTLENSDLANSCRASNNASNNNSNNQDQVRKNNPRKRNLNLNYLRVMYTNADSIINKRNELQERVSHEKPNVIVITEVNPKNQRYSTTKNELAIEGYTLFTNAENNGARGIAVYIKNHLNPVEPRSIKTEAVLEAVAVEIKLRGADKQLIMAVYRSPNSPPDNNSKLHEMIQSLNQSNYSHILLLGDFNYPELEWSSGASLGNCSQNATAFVDAVNDAFLYQHIDFPTRYRPNETSNTLDLIFTNEESMVEEVSESAPLGKSDHVVITFKLRCYIEVKDIVTTRLQYEKADFDKMNESLKYDWDDLFVNKDTEEKWQVLLEKLNQAIDHYIPAKKHTSNKTGRPL